MRIRTHRRHDSGISLLDVTVGLCISATVALIAVMYVLAAARGVRLNEDRVFAYAKAQALIEELRAVAESGETENASELDRFDDSSRLQFVLTLQTKPNSDELVAPDAPASGNRMQGTQWRYARSISVRPFASQNTRDLRVVTVRVYRLDVETQEGTEVASLSTVVRTFSKSYPPTQVFDVYLIAIENVPGWWVNMGSLKPFVEASLNDIMARNPGLELRLHWITKLGYGRNPQYTPYSNEDSASTAAVPNVYFYPGRMPAGSAALHYYVPNRMGGRLNVDGVVRNGWDATANPLPYTMADQYNHALRYPQELALFDARVAAGLEDPETPTLRIFLERLNSDPDRYRNAMVINLHGELLPLPPIRNYSDAAREPVAYPGVRAVTHPEKLRFTRDSSVPANSEDVRFRVYSYKTDPASGPEILTAPIIVEIPGMDLTANINGLEIGTTTLEIAYLRGGVDVDPMDGTRDDYEPFTMTPVFKGKGLRGGSTAGEMYVRTYYEGPVGSRPGTTVIELHGSPLVTPAIGSRGLATSDRLYGMEYIPCATESASDFSEDLYSSASEPKNTARWTITVPKEMLGGSNTRVDVITRIGLGDAHGNQQDGAAFTTGVMYPPAARNQPENVSTTYAWWSTTPESVPFTERFQFLGDPRHCPYADLKSNGSSFPNGYNWYHDDFQAGSTNALSDWPGFDASRLKNDGSSTNDGWRGVLEMDVPRAFELVRRGLVTSETLYTSMTGWSYYYVGIGNEIGYDASNGFPDSIPVAGEPFGSPGSVGYEQSITSDGSTWGAGVKYVRSSASGSYWWGMPWLGELYPDSAYAAHWRVPRYEYSDTLPLPGTLPAPRGNLPAGSASDTFKRVLRSAVTTRLPRGTELRSTTHRTGSEGCVSFFNTGTSSASFRHRARDGQRGDLTTLGQEVSADYRLPLPARPLVTRPFGVAASSDGGVGDEFNFTADYPRYSVRQRDEYYTSDTGSTGSALIEVTDPSGTSSGYQLVHGVDRSTEAGTSFIARYSIATLVHGYLRACDPALARPLAPTSRVQLVSPTAVTELKNPATVTLTWRSTWARWDDQAYTQTQSTPVSDSESVLEYRVLYSTDNGQTWKHIEDDSAGVPGVRPTDSSLLALDQNAGADESLVWSTPADRVPMGSYLLRIECWRRGSSQHLAYHQERIFIER